MRRGSMGLKTFLFFSVVILIAFSASSAGWAQTEKEKDILPRPERGIAIYTEFSSVLVVPGEGVRMELTVENKGKQDENVMLKLTQVPKGWKASLKAPNYTVEAVPVPATKTRTLTFVVDPDKTVKLGTYLFQIDAQTEDGKFTSSQKIHVIVREKAAAGEDFTVTTSYPVLQGQTDASFEFSLDVNNKSEVDRNFNLSAQVPPKWDVSFKPAYEQKQISSFRIKGGSSQTVAVQVNPAKDATSGSYPILVWVASGEKKTEVKLTVVLTGIYKLDAGTPTGLLSLEALAGKPANMSLFVKNTGSAVNKSISFSSFKPENWKVDFKPEKIEGLEPGAMKQVEVTITPAAQALVGDYSVGLSADGEKGSSKTVELRVSVKTSAAWGWVGIIIIVVVIAGLGALFLRLGRR
ncbi:MAG TPA: NEW3 domain-containing protein [Thermodesulfobacteriota bacterium]|nr:NEW3 domain-containing protein [Thermodesulfobacteriota bacterium]